MARFRQSGIPITYDWTTHGQVYSDEDLKRFGIAEEQGINQCDVFFMIFPGRAGTHVELGLARGNGKHIVLLEEAEVERKTFYHLPGVMRFKEAELAIQHTINFLDSLRS